MIIIVGSTASLLDYCKFTGLCNLLQCEDIRTCTLDKDPVPLCSTHVIDVSKDIMWQCSVYIVIFVVILLVAVIVLGLFCTFQMCSVQNVLASPDLVQLLSGQIDKINLTIVLISE
jgi:hypothetical protein